MSHAGGRPTSYTPEIADEICEAIASSELGLVHLCAQNPHWPNRSCIFKWRAKYQEFGDKYRAAKRKQTHVCIEYMQELMNEDHFYIDSQTGEKRVDVPLLRLKLDHFKWHAAKLEPRDYGDSKQIEAIDGDITEDCKKRMQEQDEKNKKPY